MKNRVEYKKVLLGSLILSLVIIILFVFVSVCEYKSYTKNFNNKIIEIVSLVKDEYKDIKEDELMDIVLSNKTNNDILTKYSINLTDKSLLKPNDALFYKHLFINIIIALLSFVITILLFIKYEKKKSKNIQDIINCIEKINHKNYELDIDEMSEDELSILKNEIYKTTIMLKESAENSLKDKLELKGSLSDISHQLKTPLTSILIILDNLLDNPDMDKNVREDFIRDIKREIININFLVQSLLKLSKLDTNTVSFIEKEVKVSNIVKESIKNVSLLSELKNIEIKLNIKEDSIIKCDEKWQIEAISNIIKNCVEHSYDNNSVIVSIMNNKVYTEIKIQDFGEGIDKKDINHIFDRFYKGKNSSHDSIGIGLALSKSTIEKSNGNIFVESSEKGTIFTIKYFK